ncbi:MAG: Gfo/Idh/MocA family oxidoreductase [Lentisphaerae bacterium]|nr:Gfo/Idh/MocA family oxidoreductase [Lentisphaerota bacterium]
MNKVRLGIIGIGGMGGAHAKEVLDGKVPRCELAAICDIDTSLFAKYPGIKAYDDSAKMIRSGDVDAVLIATPHYDHTTIGIDALQNGIHTLVEKPISVHKADAEKLIAAHDDPKIKFAAMFNQRTDPYYIKIHDLIKKGEIGKIQRSNWIITNWFRTEAYYRSGGWRATWAGEGGGVLVNQCPHNLDLYQWLCGMPSSVIAIGGLGKFHDIEVEDDVSALFEYPDGATGAFFTTTGEAPGTNRLEIAGDRGKLVFEIARGVRKLEFIRNEVPAGEYLKTSSNRFGVPSIWNVEVPISGGTGEQHLGIKKNFVAAILDNVPLIAPAEDGIRSVEIANAMQYSLMTKKRVDLPMDGAAYEAYLKQLIAKSTFKKVTDKNTDSNVGGSFNI